MYRNMQCLITQYLVLHTHLENYNCCVVVAFIIIHHHLGLDRPVSASSNSLFKDLLSHFVHLVYIL